MLRPLLSLSILVSSLSVMASPFHGHKLDPEMTGREYLALLEKQEAPKNKKALSSEDQEIENFLAIGKRNLQWVDLVNSVRTPETKISLSSIATQAGSPITSPRTYNFKIIADKWKILIALLPAPLKKVLIDGAPLTTVTGVSDREFTERLFEVDNAYQIAARYKMMKPWQTELAAGAALDIRGYVSLTEETDLNQLLTDWDALPALKQSRLNRNLLMTCLNSQTDRASCVTELNSAIANKTLITFKDKYISFGKQIYDSFFNIAGSRPDGVWTAADPNNFVIPFANPHNDVVLDFLRFNIEEEWQWNGWQLHLDFQETQDASMTHVVFEAGATPHVDNAPGTVITMDDNAPLSEYDVQWTIRHEYGHVLGFPDCYHEFYDEEAEAFVSYQLDVTNLMCSRRGKLQQTHYDELKRVYFKN